MLTLIILLCIFGFIFLTLIVCTQKTTDNSKNFIVQTDRCYPKLFCLPTNFNRGECYEFAIGKDAKPLTIKVGNELNDKILLYNGTLCTSLVSVQTVCCL